MTRWFLLLTLFVPSLAPAAELKAGAFAIDVTPRKYPVSVNGGMSDREVSSAHDPIHARCLVLDDGKTKVAIVTVDSCMIPRELIDDAKAKAEKATGIPGSNILISATHTHSAPTVAGVFQSDPDEDYVPYLADKIAEGIEKAHANRVPAKAGWNVIPEPAHLHNRRWVMKPTFDLTNPFGEKDKVRMNPPRNVPELVETAGPIDPDLSVLSVQTSDGKPLALHANYSLHYVGGLPALSADYFGVFCDRVGGIIRADAKFMPALSNGTSGDVNNVVFQGTPSPRTQPGEQLRHVAEAVAQVAGKAVAGTKHSSDVTLAAAEREVELKVRKPSASDIERAEKILAAAKGRELKSREEIYARETVLLAKYPDTVKLKLLALRIGDLGITAIPCEVFTDIGLAIKKQTPLKGTFNISLANGYNGYLPTPAQHALGGYETWRARSSYLETTASDTITKVVLELLNEVAKK